MGNYIFGYNGELYHAKHTWTKEDHKYIKREWKNGKWVYTYPSDVKGKKADSKNGAVKKDSSTKSKSSVLDSLSEWFGFEARDKVREAEKRKSETEKKTEEATETYKRARDAASADMYITEQEQYDVNNARFDKKLKDLAMTQAGKDYVKANEAYMKTPLGKLEKASADVKAWFEDLTDGKSEMDEALRYLAEKAAEERAEKAAEARYEAALEETAKKDKEDKKIKEDKKDIEDKKEYDPLSLLPIKTNPTTPAQDQALVNPNFYSEVSFWDLFNPSKEYLWDENCAACTLTYDLRRRGYDVTARDENSTANDGTGTVGMIDEDIAKCYKNTTEDDFVTADDILRKAGLQSDTIPGALRKLEKELVNQGEGARGQFLVDWKDGGRHSVSYEVENGKVVIRDCQTNKTYELADYGDKIKFFKYLRTDNREPSEKILQYVQNRRGE